MRRPLSALRGPSSRRLRPAGMGTAVTERGALATPPAQGLPALDPSAGAAVARVHSPAWPPHRRRSASPPDRRRRACPPRRPAETPSTPRPLGRRGHAPPAAARVALARRAPVSRHSKCA